MKLNKEELEKANMFIKKVGEAAKQVPWGKSVTIPCSCGGVLTVARSDYNGHIHAKCNKCSMCLMQ